MPSVDYTYDACRLGDYATFTRTFENQDFALFAELSGDRNPLHWDETYSAESQFARPIVPLHVVAAPLSFVAGMIFPGLRALYLGNEIRAIKPVYYGEELIYSARIIGKSDASRTLKIRTIAFRATEPVLDATLRVQVRNDAELTHDVPKSADVTVSNVNDRRTVLITGAGGEIGCVTAEILARRGLGLVLVARSAVPNENTLAELCEKSGATLSCHIADLAQDDDLARLIEVIANTEHPVTDFLHAASPVVDTSLNDLMAVNFSALRALSEACLPNMLVRQEGRLVLVGSAALHSSSARLENYVAAKAAASTFLLGMGRRFRPYGVTAQVVAPGYVNTSYSQALRHSDDAYLLVEEVADILATSIADPTGPETEYLLVDPAGTRRGQFGFHMASREVSTISAVDTVAPDTATQVEAAQVPAVQSGRLDNLFRDFFVLPPSANLDDAALDQTPGWDSLRHIEFMMLLESTMGIVVASHEIEETRRYSDLVSLIDRKLLGKTHGFT